MQGQQIESNQNYTEVISLCIEKVVNQLIKSGQIIERLKSLEAIINNNLTNISKSKSTSIELKRIINSDKTLESKILLMMKNLQIIEINQNGKRVKFYDDRLQEFKESSYSCEDFRNRVRDSLI